MSNCNICPRKCNTDRSKNLGYCQMTDSVTVARAALHMWEEPCISGTRGSGAVFFCGCNLKCVYCQNYEISRGNTGKKISVKRLSEIFIELQEKKAHNINLVTPTHFLPQIKTALKTVEGSLNIPVVYNCGGYELKESIEGLSGYADIFLTDVKYYDNSLAERLSCAKNYFEISISALDSMIETVGTPVFSDDGIMQKGVIVRHLVLPGQRQDSIEILKRLKNRYGCDKFILSLMSQFTPNGRLEGFPELNRRITSFEYNSVVDTAYDLGFHNAYVQEKSSAKEEYTPPFDLTGI